MSRWLEYKEGILCAEGVPFPELAEKFGTPCYVYSAFQIRENVKAFRQAFSRLPLKLCYAVKANPNGAILKLLAGEGLGAEVVSGGELLRALRAGFPARKVVFTGVGKSQEELATALKQRIGAIVVESEEELGALVEVARGLGEVARVALRYNPDLEPATHAHLATGKAGSKFGLDGRGMERALVQTANSPWIDLVGFHVHLGSQLRAPGLYLEAAARLVHWMERAKAVGHGPRFIDLGGGFAIPYEDDEPPFPLAALGERLAEGWPEETELLLEPGRALVGPAGVLLTRVLYRKTVHGHLFAVVDAGMTELLRPALYGAVHRIVPVLARPGPKVKASVVGPICENADYLGREVHLPQVQRGDLLAVLDVGAYGASMASQYNSRPRAPEVLLLDGVAWLVRRREPLGALWEEEVVPAPLGQSGPQTP